MTNSTYTPSVHLFVDMDGTLVTWKQAACFEELLQENYFRDLPPYKEVVDAINWLNSTYPEIDVHVLSAYMPENPYSVNEKKRMAGHLSSGYSQGKPYLCSVRHQQSGSCSKSNWRIHYQFFLYFAGRLLCQPA